MVHLIIKDQVEIRDLASEARCASPALTSWGYYLICEKYQVNLLSLSLVFVFIFLFPLNLIKYFFQLYNEEINYYPGIPCYVSLLRIH